MSTDLAAHEEMRHAVQGALTDFSRRVRQAHSYDEIDADRDALTELIVELIAPRRNRERRRAGEKELEHGHRS